MPKKGESLFVNALGNAASAASGAVDHLPDALTLDDETHAHLVTNIDAAIRDLRRARRALTATPRTCEQCGARFLGRADARYCGDAHRQQAHRDGDDRPRFVERHVEGVSECGVEYAGTAVINSADAPLARAAGLEPTAEELRREQRGNGHA